MDEGKGTVSVPDNVVELHPDAERPPLEVKNAYRGCRHDRCVIDAEARTLTCKRCGETLSPFERLLEVAQNRQREYERVVIQRREAKRLAEQIESRKKELRSLDGKIKRRKAALLLLSPGPRNVDASD